MHPYLTQAVAAERGADLRRDAAADHTARFARAARTRTRHAAVLVTASRPGPASGQAPAGSACQSDMSRAA